MENQGVERREFRRIFFPKEDNILALITFSGIQKEPVEAGVMSLSEEGICLIYKKNDAIKISKKDVLILTQLKGLTPELFQEEFKIEVRWIMSEAFFDHDQIGCKIINVSESYREQIRQIDSPGVII